MVDWSAVKHFIQAEFGPGVTKLDARLVYILDSMRNKEDRRRRAMGRSRIIITVNEAWAERPNNLKSQHSKGRAADIVIRHRNDRESLDVFEQFLIACRYNWSGIGFYPFWNDPGIHVDTRPISLISPRALWWLDEDGKYLPIQDYLIRRFGQGGIG